MTNSARIPLTLCRRAFVGRRLRSLLARRLALAAATLCLAAGVGTPAAFASAPTTFCVHYAGYACPSGSTDEGTDLQAALDAASLQPASSAAPNVADIGPGSYVPVSGLAITVTARLGGAPATSPTIAHATVKL